MKRIISLSALIVVCYLLQTTVFQALALANIVPNLLLIIVVSIGYMRGKQEAMFYGFFTGLLVDCQFGQLIGIYALLYMLVGYVVGLCNKIYYMDEYIIPIVLVGVSDLVFNFIYFVLSFLLRNRLNFFYYFRRIMLPEVVYTVVMAVFLYKLIHIMLTKIDQPSRKEA